MNVAPRVRTNNVHIYVRTQEDAKNLASKLDLIPIEGAGNVRLSIARSNGVFYGARKIGSVQIYQMFSSMWTCLIVLLAEKKQLV